MRDGPSSGVQALGAVIVVVREGNMYGAGAYEPGRRVLAVRWRPDPIALAEAVAKAHEIAALHADLPAEDDSGEK